MNKIIVKSKNKEPTETLVSKEDYQELNKYPWYLDKDNYAFTRINGEIVRMHCYIKFNIIEENIPEDKDIIDHINRNVLDNRRENLRFVSFEENSRNVTKKENCTSKYMGVYYNSDYNTWYASMRIGTSRKRAQYSNEIHAAHQYNLWIEEYKKYTSNKNDIEVPLDFELYVSVKNDNTKYGGPLEKGIQLKKNKNGFVYETTLQYNKKRLSKKCKTYEEAVEYRRKFEKERDDFFEKKLKNENPKLVNNNGDCIFIVKGKEILIDEHLYYNIIKYKWNFRDDYLRGEVNGNLINLSKFIINDYENDYIVFFKNKNKLDYRKENLVTKIKKHVS